MQETAATPSPVTQDASQLFVKGTNPGVELVKPPLRFVALSSTVVDVTSAGTHHHILDGEGCVWSWGASACGALGLGPNAKEAKTPCRIDPSAFGGERVVKLACGPDLGAGITKRGTLYVWGSLHPDYEETYWSPMSLETKIKGPVVEVGVGSHHLVALTNNGIFTCGLQQEAALGVSSIPEASWRSIGTQVPLNLRKGDFPNNVYVRGNNTAVLTRGGCVFVWGTNFADADHWKKPIQVPVPDTSPVQHVGIGNKCMLLLLDNGEVWGVGDNGHGQLGDERPAPAKDEDSPALLVARIIPQVINQASNASSPRPSGRRKKWGKGKKTKASKMVLMPATNGPAGNLEPIKLLRVGTHMCAAVDAAGVVWAWGDHYDTPQGLKAMNFLQSAVAAPDAVVTRLPPCPFFKLNHFKVRTLRVGPDRIFGVSGFEGSSGLRFESWEPPVVSAATYDGLMAHIAGTDLSFELVHPFLLFHTRYETSEALLERVCTLHKEASAASATEVTTRLARFMEKWLLTWKYTSQSPFDDDMFQAKLNAFIKKDKALYARLRPLFTKLDRPTAVIPPPPEGKWSSILKDILSPDMQTRVIGEQLSLMESALFAGVARDELAALDWMETKKTSRSPYLRFLQKNHKKHVRWVVSAILCGNTDAQRSEILNRFCELLGVCHTLCNFASSAWIFDALDSEAITNALDTGLLRLTPKSKPIVTKYRQIHESHIQFCEKPTLNTNSMYMTLMDDLCERQAPCCPWVLGYLNYLEAVNSLPEWLEDRYINWNKITSMANTITYLEAIKRHRSYHFAEREPIYSYLFHAGGAKEDLLLAASTDICAGHSSRSEALAAVRDSLELGRGDDDDAALRPLADLEAQITSEAVATGDTVAASWGNWSHMLRSTRQEIASGDRLRLNYRQAFGRTEALPLTLSTALQKCLPLKAHQELRLTEFVCAVTGLSAEDGAQVVSFVNSMHMFAGRSEVADDHVAALEALPVTRDTVLLLRDILTGAADVSLGPQVDDLGSLLHTQITTFIASVSGDATLAASDPRSSLSPRQRSYTTVPGTWDEASAKLVAVQKRWQALHEQNLHRVEAGLAALEALPASVEQQVAAILEDEALTEAQLPAELKDSEEVSELRAALQEELELEHQLQQLQRRLRQAHERRDRAKESLRVKMRGPADTVDAAMTKQEQARLVRDRLLPDLSASTMPAMRYTLEQRKREITEATQALSARVHGIVLSLLCVLKAEGVPTNASIVTSIADSLSSFGALSSEDDATVGEEVRTLLAELLPSQ